MQEIDEEKLKQVKWIYSFVEGNKSQKDLLGSKGANLAEMTRMGIPVPPGFIITTELCREYLKSGQVPQELESEIEGALQALESQLGRNFGDSKDPLLVAVRSGAKISMPGMMETVLNVGLNDQSVKGLADKTQNQRFAWDSYRRLIQMYGKTVLGIGGEKFTAVMEEVHSRSKASSTNALATEELQEVVTRFKTLCEQESSSGFPQDPREQLRSSIRAVLESWNTERARLYRKRERIPDDLGTAVTVGSMVFGNMGADSGTGVCFTRNPANGDRHFYGDYLANAQGEDVVAGSHNTLSLDHLGESLPHVLAELSEIMKSLERHYHDMCDIEFTVEQGKLWILQTRIGKRTPAAAFRIATQLVDEGIITLDEALLRVSGKQLAHLLVPQFDREDAPKPIAQGIAASPGAVVGSAVFDSASAVKYASEGKLAILIRRETSPDDLAGMMASVGILTSRGGKTSHAAVVARGMGKAAVCGAEQLKVHEEEKFAEVLGSRINEGEIISLDGSTGEIFVGTLAVKPSTTLMALQSGKIDSSAFTSEEELETVQSIKRLLDHADQCRKLRVRANADNPVDSALARSLGAEGIGLCRTEHMFLGDRRVIIEKVILATTPEDQGAALAELVPIQREDFRAILKEMDGLVTTIRLLDPPLHEFLPDIVELSVKVALDESRGEVDPEDRRRLDALVRMREANPMLGLRGVRLGLTVPGLYAAQVQTIAEAMVMRLNEGGDPRVEIMVPLVGSQLELALARSEIERVVEEVSASSGVRLSISVGTMIEVPRAAMIADEIASVSDFFSFGTNDLTQMTWGYSRDDVEAEFFPRYMELGIFDLSPFETIDEAGVGKLVELAVERGRVGKPSLHLGVCGEHGGDPESIHVFHRIGLDYVSCSPYRVPVARLESGRAELLRPSSS